MLFELLRMLSVSRWARLAADVQATPVAATFSARAVGLCVKSETVACMLSRGAAGSRAHAMAAASADANTARSWPAPRPGAPRIIVITGPTAVGKTRVGLELARRLDGEIISADSVQARACCYM